MVLFNPWEDKGVHTFPKGICPKVNVIARVEYELAYYDSAVHRFNHYTTRTPRIVYKYLYITIYIKREEGEKYMYNYVCSYALILERSLCIYDVYICVASVQIFACVFN